MLEYDAPPARPAPASFQWIRFVATLHLAVAVVSLVVVAIAAFLIAIAYLDGEMMGRTALAGYGVPAIGGACSAFANGSVWAVLRLVTDQADDIRALVRMSCRVEYQARKTREAAEAGLEAMKWSGVLPAGER